MLKHLRYLRYVLRHKWFVFWGCMMLRVPLWQALIHDWTKFLPIEWFAYVERMAAGRNSDWYSVAETPAYAKAWKHHWSHNPHHWEYWTIKNWHRAGSPKDWENSRPAGEPGNKLVQEMPERFIREMVADWYGAGMAQGKPDIRGWYRANMNRRHLHPATQARVEALLELLP